MSRFSAHIRNNVYGLVAIFFALTMGTAWATHPGGANTISSEDIIDEEIRTWDIRDNHVRTPDLQDGAVNRFKLAKGSVVRERINNGAVNADKLANDAVNSAKVVNNSLTGDDIDESTLAGLWFTGGNAGINPTTQFLGTTDDTPLEVRVNGSRALRLEPASNGGAPSPNVIGGIPENSVMPGAHAATISGGGQQESANRVTDDYGTVGGGSNNQAGDEEGTTSDRQFSTVGGGDSNAASGSQTTVGGGQSNTASGSQTTVGGGQSNTASGPGATVGGGRNNTASGGLGSTSLGSATLGGGRNNTASGALGATVGGGEDNTASASLATVGGGQSNTASGFRATVPGGQSNTAQGNSSFAAGRGAKANHAGAFVWAGGSGLFTDDFVSTADDEFAVRASGGVRLRTSTDLSTGCNLAAGSGTWVCTSDRDTKQGFVGVDGEPVLERLAGLPITTWSFKSDPTGTRHIGPVAQDFYAAFGLGSDDKTISSVDADGVALAAIKGLHERSEDLEAVNEELAEQNERLEARVAALERAHR